MSCEDNNNGQKDCKLNAFEKNNYFYGKLMTVRDFKAEQDYFSGKRHMINRLVHGVGIVCGLEVTKLTPDGNKLTVDLNAGMALDCCGNEIVVPVGQTIESQVTLDAGKDYYIYLKYKECFTEKVPSASNTSPCKEACCDNRVRETFTLEVLAAAVNEEPDRHPMKWSDSIAWKNEWQTSEDTINNLAGLIWNARGNKKEDVADWNEAKKLVTVDKLLEKISCTSCDDPKVLIGFLVNDGTNWTIDKNKTLKCRSVVFSNPILYELIDSHLTDFSNPHNVTALQTGALVSIDGVNNPGGNVDLLNANSITIIANDNANTITIGETHSSKTTNPHNVTAEQTGALVSIDGVSNPGGNVDLLNADSITISVNDTTNTITIGETHSSDTNNPHNVTALQTGAIVSVNSLSNPGGNVELLAGANITIAPNDTNNSITISSTAGIDPATSVSSVGLLKVVGVVDKYAREDHVHDIGTGVITFDNLNTILQKQLDTVFMYLRERALKCTVMTFKAISERFVGNDNIVKRADAISEYVKVSVDNKNYEKEDDFIQAVSKYLKALAAFEEIINTAVTENTFPGFSDAITALKREEKDSLRIATAMDEVCFYAMLLQRKELKEIKPPANLDIGVANRFTDSFIEKLNPDIKEAVKTEMENFDTAVILNELNKKPGISAEEIVKRTGYTIANVNKKLTTLYGGNIVEKDENGLIRIAIK